MKKILLIFILLIYTLGYVEAKQYKGYDIPEEFLEIDKQLIELILNSQALETREDKQNWFNLLPLMTDEQIAKLKNILTKEKTKLKEIEEKYNKKRSSVINKFIIKKIKNIYKDMNITNDIYILVNQPTFTNTLDLVNIDDITIDKNSSSHVIETSFYKDIYQKIFPPNEEKINLLPWIEKSKYILSFSDREVLRQYWNYCIKNNKLYYRKIYSEREYFNLIMSLSFISGWLVDLDLMKEIKEELESLLNDKKYKNIKYLKEIVFIAKSNYNYLAKNYILEIKNYKNRFKYDDDIINNMYSFTIYRYLPDKTIKKEATNILKYIFSKIKAENKKLTDTKKLSTELLDLDFILYFNKDILDKETSKIINDFITKKLDKRDNFENNYYELNIQYFRNNFDSNYSKNDEIYNYNKLFYQAFSYYKAKNLIKADEILNIITKKTINTTHLTFNEFASLYLIKDAINFLKDEIKNNYREKLLKEEDFKSKVTKLISIIKENITFVVIVFNLILFFILTIIFVFFPYSKISRYDIIQKTFYKYIGVLLPFFNTIISKRLLKNYIQNHFPKITFLPIGKQISRNVFEQNYIPFEYKNNKEYLHTLILDNLKDNQVISLVGEGGYGKTVTAYKVMSALANDGYLPIFINTKNLDFSSIDNIEKILKYYSNDEYIVSMLLKQKFDNFIIVLDNIQKYSNYQNIIKLILSKYKNFKIIITSRDTMIEKEPKYLLSKETINFNNYLENIHNDNINIFRTLIEKIKNPLLISIILGAKIDISDIAKNNNDFNKIKNFIFDKYINYQLKNVCDNKIFNSSLDEIDCLNFLKNIIYNISILENKNIENILEIFNNFNDNYMKNCYDILKNQITNLKIINILSLTSLIYRENNQIIFSHDLIQEYFMNLKQDNKSLERNI